MSNQNKIKGFFAKLFRKLQLADFLWSVPIAFMGFFVYGYIQENIFGDPMYSTEWFHRAILSSLIMLLFNAAISGGLYFNFRGIYNYFYSHKSSIKEDFKNSPSWLKVLYFPLVYFLYLFALIQIFKFIITIV